MIRELRRDCAAILLAGMLAGCATTSGGGAQDPFEPINRAIFGFNEVFDDALMKPVAGAYRAALPGLVRAGVTNFFSNLEDLSIAANNLLQGKVEYALRDVMRVAINTVFGLGGLIDVASDAGLEKHNEDFGQTLGRWGFGSGPYLVLPFLGSSSVRDGIALPIDYMADPVWSADHVPTRNTFYAWRVVDNRANTLDASRVLEEAALDKYRFVRESYLQRRRNLVYDGDPPRDPAQGASSAPNWKASDPARTGGTPAPAPSAERADGPSGPGTEIDPRARAAAGNAVHNLN